MTLADPSPYGSWRSPVTVDLMTATAVRLDAPMIDGDTFYWLEGRADQGGRTSLWSRRSDGELVEVTPAPHYVRTMVHEYGGGAYDVADGVIVCCDLESGGVVRIDADRTVALTPSGTRFRYADLRVHPDRDLVLAVREDHGGDGEAVNTIVALSLSGSNASGGSVLCSGADFYSTPQLSATGRLAWVEWNHPDMPWDATRLMTAAFDGANLTNARLVAGSGGESIVQPRWTPTGELIFVSDRTNWWNLYADDGTTTRALYSLEAEFCEPQWVFGKSPYAVVDHDQLLTSWQQDGAAHLGLLRLSDGTMRPYDLGVSSISAVRSSGRQAILQVGYVDRPDAVILLDLTPDFNGAGAVTELRRSSEVALSPDFVSVAVPISWPGEQGQVYGWFYPPTNPDFVAEQGSRPPLITMSHGGPTSNSPASFAISIQYWTSRGFAVLDVNYGGSTGYGREYRERLKGQWGVVDVADCASGAQAMADRGLVDPERLAIVGGSAGGYTTLRALTATDTFTAGISLYGIGDLETLATDTHKFESRYLDSLIGPYPAARAVYRDRSPINHLDQLNCPILLLQGRDDRVVLPNQAEAMAAAATEKGLPVAMIIFEGEGHGFRKAENIKASIEAQLAFYGRVFGFIPADDLHPIEITNLS